MENYLLKKVNDFRLKSNDFPLHSDDFLLKTDGFLLDINDFPLKAGCFFMRTDYFLSKADDLRNENRRFPIGFSLKTYLLSSENVSGNNGFLFLNFRKQCSGCLLQKMFFFVVWGGVKEKDMFSVAPTFGKTYYFLGF